MKLSDPKKTLFKKKTILFIYLLISQEGSGVSGKILGFIKIPRKVLGELYWEFTMGGSP